MERFTFEIHKEQLNAEAQGYFVKSAGLADESDKSKRMLKDANEIKNEIEESLRIKVAVSFFSNFEVHEDTLTIERVSFKCNPFSLLCQKDVKGVYLYVITAGDYNIENRGILDQLYVDIWKTAYLDAGRNALKKLLLEQYYSKNRNTESFKEIIIAGSFGPGFYGMEPKDIMKIVKLVDSAGIGVECNESEIMSPIQTCAGIYLLLESGTLFPGEECDTCLGSRMNCNMCNVRGK